MSLAVSAFSVLVVLCSHSPLTTGEPARPCSPDDCKLPDCLCSGTSIPGGNLTASSIPQIVYITFDAAVNSYGFPIYEKLFNGQFKNPNGCNISATFFVSHEFTNYSMVQNLYSQRHEIADNSISRRTPSTWWQNATEQQWAQEMDGMREILRKWGNVAAKDVKGVRAPYIQIGGNTEFEMLRKYEFLYESSMPTQKYIDPPLWPYTLTYRSTQDCVIKPCPTDSFPGVWEVPLVDYNDKYRKHCNFITSCTPPKSEEEAFTLLYSNFQRHYETNRAPFPMLLEAVWLKNPDLQNFNATQRFLRNLTAMDDVWVVTISQAIEWVKKPTSLDHIMDFEPWKCTSEPPPGCAPDQVKDCYYPDKQRWMTTCAPECPPHYPWVGNPDGK